VRPTGFLELSKKIFRPSTLGLCSRLDHQPRLDRIEEMDGFIGIIPCHTFSFRFTLRPWLYPLYMAYCYVVYNGRIKLDFLFVCVFFCYKYPHWGLVKYSFRFQF
jgi:hypothetical protein